MALRKNLILRSRRRRRLEGRTAPIQPNWDSTSSCRMGRAARNPSTRGTRRELPPPRLPWAPRSIPQNFGLQVGERRHVADLRTAKVELLQRGEASERRHVPDPRTAETELLQRGEVGQRRQFADLRILKV